MSRRQTEVAIIGGGPAGLTAAIALARAGVETALVSPPRRQQDYRTTALLLSSITVLDTLGLWERCRTQAAPMRVMRIVDDTGRLIRAPEIKFDAAEVGLDAFGYNIENRHLLAALDASLAETAVVRFGDEAKAVDIAEDRVLISLADETELSARLVIGADGRHSLCRAAAGIETRVRSYPQTALTFNLGHARPHNDVTTEFQASAGPFTLVPLPGNRSSLVYVTDPRRAAAIAEMDDAAVARELERRSHSILGKLTIEPGRGAFPLAIQTAHRLSGNRVALVGEAAHVLPPIGAQGLNLGLRDAATIAEIVVDARRDGADPGAPASLKRYRERRALDVASRTLAVDLLNRSLLSDFVPLQAMRQLGAFLLQQIGPLRRAVMREGVTPALSQPRLMRGEVL